MRAGADDDVARALWESDGRAEDGYDAAGGESLGGDEEIGRGVGRVGGAAPGHDGDFFSGEGDGGGRESLGAGADHCDVGTRREGDGGARGCDCASGGQGLACDDELGGGVCCVGGAGEGQYGGVGGWSGGCEELGASANDCHIASLGYSDGGS